MNHTSPLPEKIVIYTAIAGAGRDVLVDPVPDPRIDYVCFTDQPFTSRVWDIRLFHFNKTCDNRTAKHPKVLPQSYFPDHDISLWIDGNITPGPNIATVINLYLENHDIAVHKHPKRNCIYQEAKVLLNCSLDDHKTIKRQIRRYKWDQFPKNFGLWECGILFRRHNKPEIKQAMIDWYNEIQSGSKKDQMSFAWVIRKHNLKTRTINGNLRNSPFFAFRPH